MSADSEAPEATKRPFEGVRIVDATHVLAGPFCTYQLALLGADVIRVERPEPGIIRCGGPDPELSRAGMGAGFLGLNANKRSIALDLKDDRGKEVFRRLAAGADVLTENFRPGVMARLGLGAAELQRLNPKLVYCSITGFGQSGPWKDRPAYDHIIQGISGAMSVTGSKESGPMRVGFPVIDYVAGLLAAFAISSALYQRRDTGRGQVIDCAMLDATLTVMGSLIAAYLVGGRVPGLAGNLAFSGSAFSGRFATRDGMIMVAANTQAQGVALCRVLGRDDIAADRRAAEPDGAFIDEVHAVLNRAFAERTSEEWEEILAAAGVPCGAIRTLPEILEHPQIAERGLLHAVADVPGIGRDITVPGVGFALAHGGARVSAPPPRHGAHSAALLDELGYGAGDIAELAADGVVIMASDDGA